jgi:hypothetical protein
MEPIVECLYATVRLVVDALSALFLHSVALIV